MTGVAFAGEPLAARVVSRHDAAWAGADAFGGPESSRTVAMIEFELWRIPQFASVSEAAIRATDSAFVARRAGRWAEALPFLERAESRLSRHDRGALSREPRRRGARTASSRAAR